MSPPDLYRSEAFAEDLIDFGCEPLALQPARLVRPPDARAARARGLLDLVRATFGPRSLRRPRRESGTAVQGA